MSTSTPAEQNLDHSSIQKAFRSVKFLVGCYLVISLLTVVAIIVLSNDPKLVNDQAWWRGIIVALTSILMFAFTVSASRGSSRGLLRLRLVSAIVFVAFAIILFVLPLPDWMRIEQAVCAVILLVIVVLVNSKQILSLFANK